MTPIGEKIYQLRKEKDLSQEELADKLNVARQTVSKWEVGTASPNFEKLTALCKFFEVESDYFISEREVSMTRAEDAQSGPEKETLTVIEAQKISPEIKEDGEHKSKGKKLKIVLTVIAAIVLAFSIVIGICLAILYTNPNKSPIGVTLSYSNYIFNYIGIISACVAMVALIAILVLLIFYIKNSKK